MRDAVNRTAKRPFFSSVGTVFAIVLMLIFGLVAMHSLSGTATAREALVPASTATASDTVRAADALTLDGSVSGASADCDASCAHGTAPDHGHLGMLMLCMLALLTGVLFLLRPALFRLSRAAAQSAGWLNRALPAPQATRPPSLFALSISRT
ncbi:DUF6153 family protein [Leucobacter soli]|uniref:DUF6153 family protein n=1 Tax=Leucobacter soli TaxID=2812850 RepID=UPI001C4086F1|nr:DUF6153 family protein [Leucobacter soli]